MMLGIYGPTVTGKTNLAIELAKNFNGELISADSRQVYRNLDTGTGKVSFQSQVEKHKGYWIVDRVKINGFDLITPGKRFSAADFVISASSTITQITRAKKLPIIVGGTGFYIKALLGGIDSIGIMPDNQLRHKLEAQPVSDLYQKLLKVDSNRAKSMNDSDRQNPRRLIRAIEIAIYNKKHETRNQKLTTKLPNYQTTNCLLIGLTAPNSFLYQKADKWLEIRLNNRLVDEIRNLLAQNVNYKWLESLGLEYKWLTYYLRKKISKEQAVKRLKDDIHGFIRRQKTWFSQFPNIKLYDISTSNWKNQLVKKVELWYTRENAGRKNSNKN